MLINELYKKQLELHQIENDCYAFYSNREMTLVKNIYSDIVSFHQFLTENVVNHFHPVRCDSVKSIFYHEIGHFCKDFILHGSSAIEFKEIIIELEVSLIGRYIPNYTLLDLNKVEYSLISEKVSEYSAFSEDELIAEIISEYLTLLEDSRSTAKKYGKKLLHLVKKVNSELEMLK
jgi:hypothetical protein